MPVNPLGVELMRVSEALDLSAVHAITKKRSAVLGGLLHPSANRSCTDFEARFEILMDNPRDEMKRRFPTFHRAICIVSSGWFRALVSMSVIWNFTANFVVVYFETTEMPICVPKHYTDSDVISVTVLWLGTFLFSMVQLLLLNLAPLVYTGQFFGSVKDDMNYGPADMYNPSAYGYYRLLEGQLRLISEEAVASGHDQGDVPKEDWTTVFLLHRLPAAYFSVWSIICFTYNLDVLAGTKINGGISQCVTYSQSLNLLAIFGFYIPALFSFSLTVIAVGVALYGLRIGSVASSRHILDWMDRYRSLKDANLVDLPPSNDPAAAAAIIRKNAFESYFLSQRIISSSSKIWSTFLLLLFSLTSICAIIFLVVIYSTAAQTSSSYFIAYSYFWEILFWCELALPLYLISQTNAPHTRLVQMFTWSIPQPVAFDTRRAELHDEEDAALLESGISGRAGGSGAVGDSIPPPLQTHRMLCLPSGGDYTLLGGRREWLAYVAQAPIYWVVAGVPITYEKLSGVVFSAALSTAVSLVPKIFKSV